MPVKNYVMETLADVKKSNDKIGFKAKINLDEGLDLLAKYYGAYDKKHNVHGKNSA